MDVAPLEQVNAKVLTEAAHLFEVKPARLYQYRGTHGLRGAKVYAAPNPPFGALLYYDLAGKATAPVRLVIRDARGNTVTELKGSTEAGLHRVIWPLRTSPPEGSKTGSLVSPGEYVVELRIGDTVQTQRFRVEADE